MADNPKVEIELRPMTWASHVRVDGKELPCGRIAVIADPASGRNETRVELTYFPVDERGSYHEPSIDVTGYLLDDAEYARYCAWRIEHDRQDAPAAAN